MTATSDTGPNDLLATAGGNATAGGVTFQAEVGAKFAVRLLVERRLPERFGLGDASIRSLRFETEAPVDDILIETDAAGWIFAQVKSSLTLSSTSDSELGSVADQIVRQWHACAQGTGQRGWDRPLDRTRDRILIAVGRNSPATVSEHLASALTAIQANSTAPLPMRQRMALDTLIARLGDAWQALVGTPPDATAMRSMLRLVRIWQFDFDGAHRQLAIELLRPLLDDENSAEAAFAVLTRRCQGLMETRLGNDGSGFRRDLAQARIALKAPTSFQHDVEVLRAYSNDTQALLGHYEETRVGDRDIGISRQCTFAVCLAAITDSLLIIGEPGSGKSAVLSTAAKYLREQKLDVVTLAVDRLVVDTSEALRRELGVSHPLRDVLRNWPGLDPAFLFIDALDATRGGVSDTVFRNLIADVLALGERWRVVASIRTFDLRLGEQFRQLFRGAPPDSQFADASFRDVRHVQVPPWTKEELDEFLSLAPQVATAVQKGGQPLYDLALVPFNTRLLADLISDGFPPEDFGEVSSQVELLQLYWQRRVQRHGTAAELCLRRAVAEMVDGRVLRANKLNVAGNDPAAFDALLHENVLVPLSGDRHVAFRHHILFDYAASRVYLDPGDISRTAALLASNSDLGLMLAPALAFALQGLWSTSGSGRASFWSAIVTIAGTTNSDPIARSVAARAACEFPVTEDDVKGLAAALQKPRDQRGRAVSAFSHIIGGARDTLGRQGDSRFRALVVSGGRGEPRRDRRRMAAPHLAVPASRTGAQLRVPPPVGGCRAWAPPVRTGSSRQRLAAYCRRHWLCCRHLRIGTCRFTNAAPRTSYAGAGSSSWRPRSSLACAQDKGDLGGRPGLCGANLWCDLRLRDYGHQQNLDRSQPHPAAHDYTAAELWNGQLCSEGGVSEFPHSTSVPRHRRAG
jgi:hypothetical protein